MRKKIYLFVYEPEKCLKKINDNYLLQPSRLYRIIVIYLHVRIKENYL